MTVPITISFIRRLTANPPTKRTEFRDSSLLGFLVRHSPSGHIAYYAQLRRGKRVRIGVHPAVTATQARDAVRKLLSAETLASIRTARASGLGTSCASITSHGAVRT